MSPAGGGPPGGRRRRDRPRLALLFLLLLVAVGALATALEHDPAERGSAPRDQTRGSTWAPDGTITGTLTDRAPGDRTDEGNH